MTSKKLNPLEVRASNAVLISTSISVWTARKHDKTISTEIAKAHGAKSAESAGRYNKVLVHTDVLRKIEQNRNAARTFNYNVTLAWGDDGWRVLGGAKFFDWEAKMLEFRETHDTLVAEFLENYPDYIDEARLRLNGMFNENDYPSVAEIASKFGFGYSLRKIEDASDVRTDLGGELEAKVREDIEQRVQAAWHDAESELVKRTVTCVQHVADRLRAYGDLQKAGKKGKLYESVIGNLRELVDWMPAMNIAGDAELDRIIGTLKTTLYPLDTGELKNSESVREETIKNAQAALDDLSAIYGGGK